MSFSNFEHELNEVQLNAVTQTSGPLLVLAGAGTGKTRVLTSRIAHIITSNLASPSEILAVTFTNKAAKEMQERIYKLCNGHYAMAVGTFHSIAAKILRQHAELVGITSHFNIADQDDQLKIIKAILQGLNIDIKETPPKLILSIISKWKDMGISHLEVSSSDMGTSAHNIARKVYELYQHKLTSSNLCDFGDLLLYNTIIFFKYPEILAKLQSQYKYILIDEYQDTNAVQYLWARMLADKHKNICCVGDDDQSIYSWRGAELENILRFEKDFPNATVIALEQNYRSTSHILKAASSLIKNNNHRHKKTLWTDLRAGDPIKIVSCYNDKEEARFISNNISNILLNNQIRANDIAILVRAGFQTRAFEEAFIASSIQYKIIGGLKFYERAEIKDILAYIRLILNNNDDVAFERIINTPKRAIGPSSLLQIKNYAAANSLPYLRACEEMLTQNIFKPKLQESILNFVKLINKFSAEFAESRNHSEVTKSLVAETGYRDMLKIEKTEESRAKLDNLREFINAISEYSNIFEFMEHTSLIMDNDSKSDQTEQVNIMTIHASKGLEFDTVFIPGMEEGIFPHQKSITEEGAKGLEEERRIAYVGITRAKKNLFLLYSDSRRIFHEFVQSIPSRFLNEIPKECIVKTTATGFYYKNYSNTAREVRENFYNKAQPPKLNIAENYIKEENGIRPGAKVIHKTFGSGIVLRKNSDNLEIVFANNTIKTIKESFVSLL